MLETSIASLLQVPLSRRRNYLAVSIRAWKNLNEGRLCLPIFTRREHDMRCFWEQTGILGPIYRLPGQGLNDGDIASQLDLAEVNQRQGLLVVFGDIDAF